MDPLRNLCLHKEGKTDKREQESGKSYIREGTISWHTAEDKAFLDIFAARQPNSKNCYLL